ncbi:hypothetical protein, partial [Oharaeibacter diazotrophicus]|uniref:hypothetical protein n=1 Tax=Oharaeibacter diazotrophicus TaxID=1920512 RepID=UPI001A99781D
MRTKHAAPDPMHRHDGHRFPDPPGPIREPSGASRLRRAPEHPEDTTMTIARSAFAAALATLAFGAAVPHASAAAT